MGTKDHPTPATVTVGVPHQSADRAMALYEAIDAGDHDARLDAIERMARSRRSYDRRAIHLQAPVPTGLEQADLIAQIQHGYYSQGRDAMPLILEAVSNRKVQLRNAALDAKQAELAAAAPTLHRGDRVRVRLDAPTNTPSSVLLGNHGTVARVLQARAAVSFDPDQPMGRFANQPDVKVPIAWLERLTLANDPAAALDRIAAAMADATDWSMDTLDTISTILDLTGRKVG
jgi:hypothetical protein